METLPDYLREDTREWAQEILTEFELGDHHIKILILACEALDRISEAREVIAKEGAYYKDRFGKPKTHPALAVEKDNKIIFARLMRELCLDIEAPGDTGRPPGL